MDGSSDSAKSGENRTAQHSTLTPAILGIPSGSYGVKLSSNMNSKDKEQLLLKLEAWREARKEKLISTIMAKGKQSSSSKLPPALPTPKMKTMSNPTTGTDAKQNSSDGKKSVFDRLYEDASKAGMKKPEENKTEKITTTKPVVKPSKYRPFGKVKVPKVILFNNADDISGPSTGTACGTVHVTEAVSEKKEQVEVERRDSENLPKEAEEDTKLLMPEEKVTKVKDEPTAEPHVFDSHSYEMTQRTNLSLFEEDSSNELRGGSEEQAEVSGTPDNAEGTFSESLQETNLSAHAEENITEKPNTVEEKTDELKKDDVGVNFDLKKSVCFETPKERVLSAIHLRNKLEDWLTQQGHSLDSYRHLRCFGLHGGKTPISRQAKIDDTSNSSFYSTAPNTPVSEVIDESDKENVTPLVSTPKIDIKDVEGLLGDLHHLIVHVEYPSDRCEEWLNAITRKFPSCTQLPVYWECLAAMNGDASILKSVEGNEESEKRENEEHNASMAELFDKLMIDEKCHSASKIERGLSMKNIFKSKTVKFALQEKLVKEMDPALGTEARRKVLVATPVRRSARLQTPDKSNIIDSLHTLDPETRRSVSFQPNEALLTG